MNARAWHKALTGLAAAPPLPCRSRPRFYRPSLLCRDCLVARFYFAPLRILTHPRRHG